MTRTDMKAEELKEKFKPLVYPYLGSGMLTNTHDDGTIDMNASKCVEIAEEHANQRVIEELDLLRQKLTHISFTAHCIDEINDRIKELKQE